MKRLALLLSCLILSLFIIFPALPVNAAEVLTLRNATQKDVYDYILTENLKKGLLIKSLSEYNITFEDPRKKDIQFILNWGSDAKLVHVFNIAPIGQNVIVSYEVQIISNAGALDETTQVASKETISTSPSPFREDLVLGYKMTKNTLRSMKAVFNGIYLYGFSYELKHKQIWVTKIWPNLPASKAGLLAGDKIIKINEIDLTTLEDDGILEMVMSGEAGAKISVTAIRDEQEMPLTMAKQFTPPLFKQ